MGNAVAREMATIKAQEDPLAARCRAGDLDAFEEVYRRWERPIYRYAWGVLADADEADDVKQETFLKAFRSFHAFDGRCAIHTWLFGICVNLCKDRIKRRSRRPEIEMDDETLANIPGGPGSDPAHAIMAGNEQALVMKALAVLPEKQRELLLLREVQGLSYQEIQAVFRCSLASVKLRLFRARQQWRRSYQALCEEGDQS
jgi:RNA polymerase sigma-70 factor, ECF subfamily